MWKPTNAPSPNPTAAPEPQPQPQQRTFTPPAEPVTAPRPAGAPLNTQEQATLGKSLVIKGEVTGSESLYIDGRVEGSINSAGKSRHHRTQRRCLGQHLRPRDRGAGQGPRQLTASDRVDIRGEGSLTGDVVAQRISIEDGAYFKGGIDIRKPGQKVNGEAKEATPAVATDTGSAIAARA